MRVLVSAASRHGATAELAEAIADGLVADGRTVEVVPPTEVVDVGRYDAVVLGSAVYMGRWLAPARELVDRCGEQLRERPVWLFSSGPVGDPPKPAGDPADAAAMREATRAREHRVLGGKLDKRGLSLAERAVVGVLRAPQRDDRDWSAVRAWTTSIAEALDTLGSRP